MPINCLFSFCRARPRSLVALNIRLVGGEWELHTPYSVVELELLPTPPHPSHAIICHCRVNCSHLVDSVALFGLHPAQIRSDAVRYDALLPIASRREIAGGKLAKTTGLKGNVMKRVLQRVQVRLCRTDRLPFGLVGHSIAE
jgi:hypothetical protein